MTIRRRSSSANLAGAASGALLLCALAVPAASAQASSPDASSCNIVTGGKGVNDGRTVFPQGASFLVEGRAGCAPPNGDVRVEAESDRSPFATFRAQRDGSYRSPSITLPRHLTLGPQRIVIVTEGGREYGIPILIYESALGPAVSLAPSTPAPVTATPVSSGRNLRYVFWALALVVAGTVVMLAAIRRGFAWNSVRTTGLSLGRRRPPVPEALPVRAKARGRNASGPNPANEVPSQAGPVTETDELDDFLGAR